MQSSGKSKILLVDTRPGSAVVSRLEACGCCVVTQAADAGDAAQQASGADLVVLAVIPGEEVAAVETAQGIAAQRLVPILFVVEDSEDGSLDVLAGAPHAGLVATSASPSLWKAAVQAALSPYGMNSERKRLEAQIESEGQHYARLMQTSSDAIHVLDEAGNLVDWNEAFLAHLGVTAEEAAHLNVADWDAQWSAAELPGILNSLLREPRTFETRHRRKDGSLIDVHITVSTFERDGKKFLYASARDMTEYKRILAALQAGERRYRQLFNNMQDGFALHEVIRDDEAGEVVDFRILDANPAYENHTGLKPWEVIGRTIREVNPSARPDLIQTYGRVALTGEPLEYEYYSNAFDRHLRVRLFSPQPGQFASVFEDVSETRKAEAALRDSEEKYRVLFENEIYAIMIYDQETLRVLDANNAFLRLSGYARDELLAGSTTVLDLSTEVDASIQSIQGMLLNGPTFVPLRYYHKKDGTPFPVEIVSGVYTWRGKKVVFALLHDISERVEAERRLVESEARFRSLFEQTHDAVFILDLQGRHLAANQRACEMLGYTAEEIKALSVNETSAELEKSSGVIARLMDGEQVPTYERLFRRKDGTPLPVEINVELVRGDDGKPLHIQSVVRDISKRKWDEAVLKAAHDELSLRVEQVERLQAELQEQAIRDPLTGLYNRRYLSEMLEREIKRAERENTPLSIIVTDIDHFKGINDTHGHQVGDLVLVEIARLLKNSTRGSDIACRHGGEEFLLVLPGATAEAASQRADEIRRACMEAMIPYDGLELRMSLSFGVAAYPEHGSRGDEIIIKADKAMYISKGKGRNRVTVWSNS